ncbi:alpha/beta hydrolase-fold protein [Erythrobacter sp. sf7]|uniref:Alpha/beta hydrolase-fold protein n=1 Tax=Erythrobacter fulvus TaxID=2987523 RepID=A0ABT5JNR0_9SPHN|nr:alpha/beta hydrolase-fold protein [Erythrobacter fulvus]MDC8754005.1 alpha/beta hydrolase-fold protein [Erythrobacter fulvus]
MRLIFALLALPTCLVAPLRAQETGPLIEYEHVPAAGLPDQRLSIWLPPGYDVGERRYPVLYMHDGHNLFDVAKSNFNKIWAADKAMLAASASGKVEPHIIIGIWAPGADRYRQYLPRSAYDAVGGPLRAQMDATAGGEVVSDRYLAWIAGPLKSWVDTAFRTRPARDDTAIIGSSMGGLMSCYAFVERADVFGRAGCVSSHWPAIDPQIVEGESDAVKALWDGWFAARLGAPDGRRVWMDHGTATLDAYYAPYQQVIDKRFAAAGWVKGRDWQSKVYEGAEHEENAWAARLPEIFGWLLAKSD